MTATASASCASESLILRRASACDEMLATCIILHPRGRCMRDPFGRRRGPAAQLEHALRSERLQHGAEKAVCVDRPGLLTATDPPLDAPPQPRSSRPLASRSASTQSLRLAPGHASRTGSRNVGMATSIRPIPSDLSHVCLA
ncbi:hypothetical protein K491DRAFT_353603 [Lophiostoma macrostomum CBS 122681]|uniref:Uncharacterized protein n=1 Tax=Lophiostoma macrostomum CBS 122681 TaxID=1314788 RepID=A0A6A6TDB6_9PLEO|nr:hypothetical protein K491DRAFT_353603 [Lophiostoma macrostomum CBS 122681]